MRSNSLLAVGLAVILCSLGCIPAWSAAPEPISLNQQEITSSFGKRVEILDNAPWEMTVEEALVSTELVPFTEELVNLGAQTSPAWVRFRVRNDTERWGAWLLNSFRSNVETLEMYRVDDGHIQLLFDNANDDQRRESLKRHFNLVAELNLGPGETTTILVRFQAAVSGWLPMRILPTHLLTQFTFSQFALFIFSVAGTGVLIFFNLLLFLATRDRLYVLYTAATSGLLMACLHLQGMTTSWWFYATPAWGRTFGANMVCISAILLLTFARRFLNLKGRPVADFMYYLWTSILGLHLVGLTGTMLFAPGLTDWVSTTAWILSVIGFASLPLQAFFANPGLKLEEALLGTAWTVLSSQFIWLVLSGLSWVPASNLDWYLMGPACFTEAALVAVSIALRVRRLQLEKDEADALSQTAMQEMNERARLVLAASHDARNLVHGAISINEQVSLASELEKAHGDADKVGKLLANLQQTMSMMVSSNRQVGPNSIPMIETIDVPELLETLSLTFRDRAEEAGMRISWRTNTNAISADRHMVTRVLSNFVVNAITHSSGKRVLIVCRAHTDSVSLRVYDQGPGIPAEGLERILESGRAVRLSPQSIGVGVGLQSSLELANAYGGEVEAASNPEGGSMFGLVLPLPDLSAIDQPIHFLGDDEIWGSFVNLLRGSRFVSAHTGGERDLHVFSEDTGIRPKSGFNVVACYDRSNENRDRWSEFADAILCFPVTLPSLAYAAELAYRRGDKGLTT